MQRSRNSRHDANSPIRAAACLLRTALLAAGLAAAGPAGAFTGADLFREVCLAAFPSFDDAAGRLAAFNGQAVVQAIAYDGRLFEQIDAERRLSWAVDDGADMTVGPFMVDVAWGKFNALPAASCVIADKRGFALAELKGKLDVRELRVRAGKVLYATVADAIVERDDGKRLWLTLTLAAGHDDPGSGPAIAVATLMSSEYLNALMQKDQ